jgi:hypothetical protein
MNHQFLLTLLAALLDPDRRKLIELYESQIDALRSQIPDRLQFTQPQKTRMAQAAKALGRKALKELSTIVTPDTFFRWYREAVCKKWGSLQKTRSWQARDSFGYRKIHFGMGISKQRLGLYHPSKSP